MWGYIADWGVGNEDVGHRRWLLCPGNTKFGFGDVPAPSSGRWPSNAVKVFDYASTFDGPTRDGGVAWPNPGLVPRNYAEPRGMLDRFSYQVPSDVSTAGATVAIVSSSGGSVPISRTHVDDLTYCQPAIEWEPSRVPGYGETWTITVSGLSRGGTTLAPVTYAVDLRRPLPVARLRQGRLHRLHRQPPVRNGDHEPQPEPGLARGGSLLLRGGAGRIRRLDRPRDHRLLPRHPGS